MVDDINQLLKVLAELQGLDLNWGNTLFSSEDSKNMPLDEFYAHVLLHYFTTYGVEWLKMAGEIEKTKEIESYVHNDIRKNKLFVSEIIDILKIFKNLNNVLIWRTKMKKNKKIYVKKEFGTNTKVIKIDAELYDIAKALANKTSSIKDIINKFENYMKQTS